MSNLLKQLAHVPKFMLEPAFGTKDGEGPDVRVREEAPQISDLWKGLEEAPTKFRNSEASLAPGPREAPSSRWGHDTSGMASGEAGRAHGLSRSHGW